VHDAVIADIVASIRQLVEGRGNLRARPIRFTANVEGDDPPYTRPVWTPGAPGTYISVAKTPCLE
jgi:hypothetical protein